MTILVTGAAGFIGSNFVLNRTTHTDEKVVAFDKLTYSGNLKNLESINSTDNFTFIKGDIADQEKVAKILRDYQPWAIINFAAETHVDRSIHGPVDFINTNILGTFRLLEEVRSYLNDSSNNFREKFRFLHISTDEVYGSLQKNEKAFQETNNYKPNSPYSASKAAADHLVRSWFHTYQIPVLTTNCSNNYGPYHFPEKLIPLCILNALQGKDLPVYGDGQQIRDWLYVTDHCKAIEMVLADGEVGESYNIGGQNEKTNIEIVETICKLLDEKKPRSDHRSYKKQIKFVKDRPGHDRRYAVDTSKISTQLGWKPEETFNSGIRKTVNWYLNNSEWVREVQSGVYANWIIEQYQ